MGGNNDNGSGCTIFIGILVGLVFVVFIITPLIMEAVHAIMVHEGNPYGIWGDPSFDEGAKKLFHIFKWGQSNPSENFQDFKKDGVLHLNLTDQFGDPVAMRSARIVTYEVELPEGNEIRAYLVLHQFPQESAVIVDDFPPLKLDTDGNTTTTSTEDLYLQIEGELQYRWDLDHSKAILNELGLNEEDFGTYIEDLEPITPETMEAVSESKLGEHLDYNMENKEGTEIEIRFEVSNYNGEVSTTIESDIVTTGHESNQSFGGDYSIEHVTVKIGDVGLRHTYILQKAPDGTVSVTDITPQFGQELPTERPYLPNSAFKASFADEFTEVVNDRFDDYYKAKAPAVADADAKIGEYLRSGNVNHGEGWENAPIKRWSETLSLNGRRRLKDHILTQILKS